jgi:hypothetical protein
VIHGLVFNDLIKLENLSEYYTKEKNDGSEGFCQNNRTLNQIAPGNTPYPVVETAT